MTPRMPDPRSSPDPHATQPKSRAPMIILLAAIVLVVIAAFAWQRNDGPARYQAVDPAPQPAPVTPDPVIPEPALPDPLAPLPADPDPMAPTDPAQPAPTTPPTTSP